MLMALFAMFEQLYAFNIISQHYGFVITNPTFLYGMEKMIYYTKEYIPVPGGVGVIEPLTKSAFMGYLQLNGLNVPEAELEYIAESATFVSRLFHSYIPVTISLVIGGSTIIYAGYNVSKQKSLITS
jgi:hypothetical protein